MRWPSLNAKICPAARMPGSFSGVACTMSIRCPAMSFRFKRATMSTKVTVPLLASMVASTCFKILGCFCRKFGVARWKASK